MTHRSERRTTDAAFNSVERSRIGPQPRRSHSDPPLGNPSPAGREASRVRRIGTTDQATPTYLNLDQRMGWNTSSRLRSASHERTEQLRREANPSPRHAFFITHHTERRQPGSHKRANSIVAQQKHCGHRGGRVSLWEGSNATQAREKVNVLLVSICEGSKVKPRDHLRTVLQEFLPESRLTSLDWRFRKAGS